VDGGVYGDTDVVIYGGAVGVGVYVDTYDNVGADGDVADGVGAYGQGYAYAGVGVGAVVDGYIDVCDGVGRDGVVDVGNGGDTGVVVGCDDDAW